MFRKLIKVAVVGAGAMGRGIIHVLTKNPEFQVVAVADPNPAALENAKTFLPGNTLMTTNPFKVLSKKPQVLVEASSSILDAALLVDKALKERTHVVLMNAEVDQTFGRLLAKRARAKDVVLTSDSGDQHGVLIRIIDDVRQMGFKIVMAMNNKGYLDRHASPESVKDEATRRCLSLKQCTAYTDGTKLAIEMALVANGADLSLLGDGMIGPTIENLNDAFEVFDLETARNKGGVVDYVLGAKPGGSVSVIAYSDDEDDKFYMEYYKMGKGPYYQFIRPYHICHYETPLTIRRILETGKPTLVQRRRILEVGCRAKVDLKRGTRLEGVGGHHLYGLLETPNNLPIGLAEGTVLQRDKKKDENICWDDVCFPDNDVRLNLWKEQAD